MSMDREEMTPGQRAAAIRALDQEWNWSNPRCPISDIQHPPDQHLPECRLDED